MSSFAPTLAMSALKVGMQSAQQQATASQQADEIRAAQQANQRKREEQLKRSLATQRARFGAQGVSGGQSAEAALRGFVSETERNKAEDDRLATMRIGRLQSQADWSSRRNLLQLASPIKQGGTSLFRSSLGQRSLIDFS